MKKEFTLSTYDGSSPSMRLLGNVLFFYISPIIFLAICGVVIMVNKGGEHPVYQGMAVMFWVMAALIIPMAVWYLLPEKITMDQAGVKIKKGPIEKEASWQDFDVLKGTRVLGYLHPVPRTRPAIKFNTTNWKYTIQDWKFGQDAMHEALEFGAVQMKSMRGEVVDELEWLPSGLVTPGATAAAIKGEYVLLAKAGLVMMVLAFPSFLLFAFIDNLWILVLGPSLLFIGFMCLVAGAWGYADEKGKVRE